MQSKTGVGKKIKAMNSNKKVSMEPLRLLITLEGRCWKVAHDGNDKHVFNKNQESLFRVTR